MKKFICLECGGNLELNQDLTKGKCPYCSTEWVLKEPLNDESFFKYQIATEYQKTFKFSDAKRNFEDVAKMNPDFAEAWWGAFLSEYGIEVILLGGKIVEAPYILSGSDTCDTISKYRADKCFFSTRDLTHDGEIEYDDEAYFTMHRAMIKNSVQTIYLVNSEKIDRSGGRVILGDLSLTDTVISDYDFSDELKNKFPSVSFIKVE